MRRAGLAAVAKVAAPSGGRGEGEEGVLVVIERGDDLTVKSVRNLAYARTLTFDQLNAYDVLVSDDIVFTKAAYDAFVSAKLKGAATEEVSA